MGLQPGSKIEFIPEADGSWRLVKSKGSIMELAGIIEWADEPISIEEMKEGVKLHVAEHFLDGLDCV